MKTARSSYGAILPPMLMVILALATGCQEPNYRTEVVPNAQGGAEVRRVPKDPAPVRPAPIPKATAYPAPGPVETPAARSLDQRIEVLKAKVRDMNAEIDRLEKQKGEEKRP